MIVNSEFWLRGWPPNIYNNPIAEFTYLLTYSVVQSRSWEAHWFAASQEIPRISRNPKVHYRTHKRPPQLQNLLKVILMLFGTDCIQVNMETSDILKYEKDICMSHPLSFYR